MKKKMLFLMAAIALFVPSVMAAEAPTYDEENKALFANGTPVTVEARTDGVAGALVKWNGGEKLLPADNSVFGGSHDSTAKIDSTSVTVNGGTLHNVFGGGLHKSYVGTAVVTINGGKFTGKVHGGGASSYSGSTCHQPWYEGNKEKATTVVDEAIVTINGGTLTDVFGGGEGISYTKKATLIVNKSFTGNIAYATAGGSNGYADEAYVELYGGNVKVLQAVNKGFINNSDMLVDGANVENAYVSSEGANQKLGVTESASLTIKSGKVKNVAPGQSGNPGEKATTISSLLYKEGTVENMSNDFDGDMVSEAVILTFNANGETETVAVPKGGSFTADEVTELTSELENALVGSGYKFVGFFKDDKFTTVFDLTKPMNEDTTVFMKLEEVKNNTEVKNNDGKKAEDNPKTSDINLALILGMIALGGAGAFVSYKKKNSKANN